MNKPPGPLITSRRDFIKTSGAAVVGGAIAPHIGLSRNSLGANSDTLKVGLVGCGGRGNGAASQALRADNNVLLTAMGDVFPEQINGALAAFQKEADLAAKIKVEPDHRFVGLDAFQKVIDSGVDVVILATPPGFRPQHLKAAVAANKHVFCEKPVATDAPGVRSVLESAAEAKRKNLALGSGFCWRYHFARREFFKRVHDGALGDLRSIYATYLTGPVKPMPEPASRKPGMTDVEWQLRNWYNFVWLSGDGLVEQAVHSVDKIMWAMKDVPPLRCVATGGRQIPNNEGNIFDHIDVFYEFEDGVRATMAQRQIPNCHQDNSDYLAGSLGNGAIKGWDKPTIISKERWRYSGQNNDMYQTEHNELFASIREGKPINDGIWMSHSTLAAIMGRIAAYTGQEVSWDQALNSKDKLVPDNLSWDMKLPIAPMATPGRTRLT